MASMTASKDQVSQGIVWKLAKVGVLLGSALTVAACSFMKSAECSSNDTQDLIASIVSDKLKEKMGLGAHLGFTQEDIDKARSTIELELKNIRTLGGEKGAGGFTCEGSLVVNLNQEQIEVASLPVTDFDPRRSLIGYTDFSGQGFDGKTLTMPIAYGVQQTDDGDRLYGEISNLDNGFLIAYVNLAMQAIKNAKAREASEQVAPASASATQEAEAPPPVSSVVPTSVEPEPAPVSTAPVEIRPSFSCGKASTNAEKLICSDAELASLDVTLSQTYKAHLASSSDKTATKKEQVAWIKSLNSACSDVECMKAEYQKRISVLSPTAQ
jgi:uncharacterized protein YecT (DUF1311 family)